MLNQGSFNSIKPLSHPSQASAIMPSLPSPKDAPPRPTLPKKEEEEEEEEDYLSMPLPSAPLPTTRETYTQRRIRLARARESKPPHPPTTTPLPTPAALATSLAPSSKGFQMLSKLGYTPGSTLGAKGNVHARMEPLGVVVKEDRGGVGLDSERKRKVREEVEGMVGREREEEEGFRERVAREREERRVEGLVRGAMGVVEGFEGEGEGEGEEGKEGKEGKEGEEGGKRKMPTKQINVLWRGLVWQREEKERDRRIRYDLMQSLSRNTNYDDADEDRDDRLALGKEEEEVAEEDEELEAFNALEPKERLRRLVEYLRERYHYCFWCKFRYPDEGMEDCPGVTEDEHD